MFVHGRLLPGLSRCQTFTMVNVSARKYHNWPQIACVFTRHVHLFALRFSGFALTTRAFAVALRDLQALTALYVGMLFRFPCLPYLCTRSRTPNTTPTHLADLASWSPTLLPHLEDFVYMYEQIFVQH